MSIKESQQDIMKLLRQYGGLTDDSRIYFPKSTKLLMVTMQSLMRQGLVEQTEDGWELTALGREAVENFGKRPVSVHRR